MKLVEFKPDLKAERLERRRIWAKEYRSTHKALIRRQQRAWYQRRRDYVLAKVKAYRECKRTS